MRKTTMLLLVCAALAGRAQVPCKWTVDLSRAAPASWDCLRGETLELTPSFVSGRGVADLSGVESATLYWQTNGMGSAYWSRPAAVDTNSQPHRLVARWTPDCDCGAPAYAYFVGASSPSGIQYRAFGTVRMRGAPGFSPNELPLPVQVLDFARIAYTNEPWSASGLTNDFVRKTGDTMSGPLTIDSIDNGGDINRATYRGGLIEWSEDGHPDVRQLRFPKKSGDLALESDIPSTNGLASAEEVAVARLESSLVHQLLVGSNVVAEVTNYNSTVRSPQLRLLQLEEGQYKVVWAETNGLSRTLQDANRHADDAVAELASRKADRAWGKYTSGMGAEAPSNTTWVSTPVTVIAGGYEYAKVITSAGEAWVLCSNGLNAGPDTNAYFRVATLDGESLFSVERSESVLIGVRAGGITCSGNTVSIPLDVVSAEAPVCYACDDLVSQNWVNLAESLPSWVTSASASGSAGSWVWTIETTATKGFFQFRALQEGRTVIRNNAPAELSQGIWVNGSRYVPVANGSTLTWTLAQ